MGRTLILYDILKKINEEQLFLLLFFLFLIYIDTYIKEKSIIFFICWSFLVLQSQFAAKNRKMKSAIAFWFSFKCKEQKIYDAVLESVLHIHSWTCFKRIPYSKNNSIFRTFLFSMRCPY